MRKLVEFLLKFLSSRIFLVAFILCSQLLLLLTFLFRIGTDSYTLRVIFYTINIFCALKVINRYSNTSYKLAWMIIILGLPLVGGITYLMFAERKVPKRLRGRIIYHLMESRDFFPENQIEIEDEDIRQIYTYLNKNSYYPYYQNTEVEYFKSGEDFFEDIIKKIRNAKHFIFIEFFIIKKGYMLDRLIEALRAKIAEGVEVYMLYDDGGCITCLPENFESTLKSYGIKVVAFSPVTLRLSLLSKANNRSHRKIIVIDNEYGFTGGFNLADEYINKTSPFGYWKDTGVILHGEAVWNLTVMFIQFYNASVKDQETLNYYDFKINNVVPDKQSLFLPFSDSPTDTEDLARTVHLSLINHAKEYIYIHTPYLILDYDLINALTIAAKSGVEVIITVPHIPDKKTVFMVTRSNYQVLLEAGVRIFEYTPGFIHSKMIVVDDKLALNGTFNMDFRSYYLNYECGVLIAQDEEILKMRDDYLNTLKESEEITLEKAKNVNIVVLILRSILNVFAPLL